MSKKILTVDDSRTMRELIRFTLEEAGFDVTEAEDGVEGVKVAQASAFDLIITDLNMPNMDGFGLLETLRKEGAHRFTPILILTTESDDEKKQRGRALGATGWIVKPFSPEKLIQVVNKVC